MDLEDLHDRAWASRGVAVVRCGGGLVETRGPTYYLLIEPGQRALFDLRSLEGPTGWLKPRLVRLRLLDNEESPYEETVESGPDECFVRVMRHYGVSTRRTERAYLTPDSRVARIWAGSPDPREGKRRIMRAVSEQETVVATIREGVFLGQIDESIHETCEFAQHLIESLSRLSTVVEGVFEFAPGVWVHESAHIAPEARIVGPVWVGASVEVQSNDVVIGPRIIGDGPTASPAITTVPWSDLRAPEWSSAVRRLHTRRRLRRASKRIFDICFAIAMLIATIPIYPIIILLIMLEDGWPPFFAHRRQTIGGREFPCLKFRTMRKDAEAIKAQLQESNQADGPQFFIQDDPRLLRCGGVLRRFQIDELPQFINVLLGHMSVVGPRPSPDQENQFCPAWREARLSVRPGVTGLWQIRRTREPETDFQEWIRYDLEYVQHESWKLDIWILFQTIKRVLTG
jgi:lipopolysaccharide/colanic/teichoic acid biosynthesis glycosyltransferase